jgi:hypothetical protein
MAYRMVHDRCFPVNATLEAESNLYQLNYLSLPIHTSANAAHARGRVDLAGYAVLPPALMRIFLTLHPIVSTI